MNDVAVEYHRWYYDSKVWMTTEFLGVPCQKSVSDLWNYQEILAQLRPSLIVEFGAYDGGSALFFAEIGRLINPAAQVLSFEIDTSHIFPKALSHPGIRFITGSSVDPSTAQLILEARQSNPGPVFFIVDSDHTKNHVLQELELLRSVTQSGDYVVVEDGNINGHPILPAWGEGPLEAIEQYVADHPGDYVQDIERENKFGWTFAPGGFLIRR